MGKLLELFSGTQSVGKVAKEVGWQVVNVDNSSKYKPDLGVDIMQLNDKQLPEGYFDFVWASCPCEKFSIAPSQLFSKEEREARAEGERVSAAHKRNH